MQDESIYYLLTESSLNGVYLIQDNIFRYVNNALASIFGYEVHEIVNKLGPLDLTHPEDHYIVKEAIQKRISGEVRDIRYTFRGIRKDGKVIYLEVHGTRGEWKGRPAIIGTLIDVTERKRKEESLIKLTKIIELMHTMVMITDPEGNIEYVNPRFTEVTGYRPEEVIGKNPRILKSGKMPKEVYENLWSTIRSGKEWRGELINKKKNGELFYDYQVVFPMKDEKGEIINYIAVKEDITLRKNMEEQMREIQKMEAIGTLTAGIAHEFNNILTVIIGYTRLLQIKIKRGEDVEHDIETILSATKRASNLISNLLGFARKQPLEKKPLNIKKLILKSEELLKRLTRENIEMKISVPDESIVIMADENQMQQVLLNIVSNAVDAMPDGGLLSIEVARAQPENALKKVEADMALRKFAILTVSDTGIGMDENIRARIFEPFFTTKEKGKGTGLGLSVVYGIVKQHEGFIDVYSEPGMGSTFRIYLPVIETKEEHGDNAGEKQRMGL